MSTKSQFENLLATNGSNARFRRVDSAVVCPCVTPEGFRDPQWHLDNPAQPVCNERGRLADSGNTVDMVVKAFVQPIQSTRATRLSTEYLNVMFGTVQADDHLGIFPVEWNGAAINFLNWSQAGEDYIEYNSRKFMVVNANLIPAPEGDVNHHWEVGLRLMS